jgi:hypothetical protein
MSTVENSTQLFGEQGTASGQIKQSTYAELAERTGRVARQVALLTDEADQTSGQAHELHARALQQELDISALNLEAEALPDLLRALTEDYGFSWATLARCIRVTPTAVRKWRHGDEPARENKQRVARLLAFARSINSVDPRLDDIGDWLEGLMTPSATLTRCDLYRFGVDVDLLRIARSAVRVGPDNIRPEDLLDVYVPDWRTKYPNDERFAVEWDDEGMPSITFREDGE